ncbi:MAG: glycerophosphodiester phosphodiesterase family protein [Armatimonadota bacterium]
MTLPDPAWKRVPLPRFHHRFAVIAHRGNHVAAPENSLPALDAAIRCGADFVEVDLRTTRDGAIVVLHDGKLDRTTTAMGALKERSLAELRTIRLRGTDGSQSRQTVPTFVEMLRRARGRVGFYLDCKDIDPAAVAAIVDAHGMRERCVAYDDPEGCAAWRTAVPWMPSMTSPPADIRESDALRTWLDRYPVEVLDGGTAWITPELSDVARRHGAVFWPDIMAPVENPELWSAALAMNVSGLQTDHPESLIAWLRATGRR